MPKIWGFLAATFVLFIVFLAFGPLIFDGPAPNLKIVGKEASSFGLKAFDENLEEKNLSELAQEFKKDKYILSFWASWCAPCVNELPLIQNSMTDLEKKNILVFLLNQDPGPVAKVQAEMAAWKITKKLNIKGYYDLNSRILSSFGASSLPFHVGIEAGKVRWYAEGEIDWSPSSIEKRFK